MKVLDKTNAIWGAVSTVLAALLGAYWFLFLAFFVLNIVDYITGFTKAKFFEKNESSAVGAKGVVKKVMYWVVVGIAFFMSDCFIRMGELVNADLHFMVLFGWFTLATYMINEIRSILEHCVAMGIKVPAFLTKGLEVANKVIDKTTEVDKNE